VLGARRGCVDVVVEVELASRGRGLGTRGCARLGGLIEEDQLCTSYGHRGARGVVHPLTLSPIGFSDMVVGGMKKEFACLGERVKMEQRG
jgi:hypothetical protein